MAQEATDRARRAIEEIRAGKMVILVDDEERENEGDLTMAAEKVTPEAITLMATKACGLICVTLTAERVLELELPMMVAENKAPLGTAFTISIEAAEGVSTGISAADRARTIKVAADPHATKSDIVSPGHVFPLKAMPGGVLQRAGQTEGSVDLARLAGLTPAGVICEVMKPDGTMARMPDLHRFAGEHDLVVVSIADLVKYRLQRDRLISRGAETEVSVALDDRVVPFKAYIYQAIPGIKRQEYVALVAGDITDDRPVPVRAHVGCVADDIFGARTRARSPSIREIIAAIARRGRGIVLYLPPRETLEEELMLDTGRKPREVKPDDRAGEIREYGIGAQILLDLGVTRLKVISNNPHKLVGLEGWGFESVEQITLEEV